MRQLLSQAPSSNPPCAHTPTLCQAPTLCTRTHLVPGTHLVHTRAYAQLRNESSNHLSHPQRSFKRTATTLTAPCLYPDTHTHTHTQTHARVRACTCTHTHKCTNACTHTFKCIPVSNCQCCFCCWNMAQLDDWARLAANDTRAPHTHTHTYTHTYTHTDTHTHIHTYKHAHKHTRTQPIHNSYTPTAPVVVQL